jgi:hypothetical protein
MDTVIYQGKTYRVGGGTCEPVPLPDWLPTVLPAGWARIPVDPRVGEDYGRIYVKHGTLKVILSAAEYDDQRRWLHVSVSRRNRELPSWQAMCEVKDLFIGPERLALQLHPPRSQYVNIHPGVLHLWSCLDDLGLPDFRAGGDTI